MIGKLIREVVSEVVAAPANIAAGVVDGMEKAGAAFEGEPKPRKPKK